MKHQNIISQLTLEEKCYLLSGKDFWQTRNVKTKGVPNMTSWMAPTVSASRRARGISLT